MQKTFKRPLLRKRKKDQEVAASRAKLQQKYSQDAAASKNVSGSPMNPDYSSKEVSLTPSDAQDKFQKKKAMKKEKKKQKQKQIICRDFARGSCRKTKCNFLHAVATPAAESEDGRAVTVLSQQDSPVPEISVGSVNGGDQAMDVSAQQAPSASKINSRKATYDVAKADNVPKPPPNNLKIASGKEGYSPSHIKAHVGARESHRNEAPSTPQTEPKQEGSIPITHEPRHSAGKKKKVCPRLLHEGFCPFKKHCWYSHNTVAPQDKLEQNQNTKEPLGRLGDAPTQAQSVLIESTARAQPAESDNWPLLTSAYQESQDNNPYTGTSSRKTPQLVKGLEASKKKPPTKQSNTTVKITRYNRTNPALQIKPKAQFSSHPSPAVAKFPVLFSKTALFSKADPQSTTTPSSTPSMPISLTINRFMAPGSSSPTVSSSSNSSWDPATSWVSWGETNLTPETFKKYLRRYKEHIGKAELPPATLLDNRQKVNHVEFTFFPLLPYEIRHEIWEYVCLNDRNTARIRLDSRLNAEGQMQKTIVPYDCCPPILYTCKALRDIALKGFRRGFCTREGGQAHFYFNFKTDRLFINGTPEELYETANLMFMKDKARISYLAISLRDYLCARTNFDGTKEDFAAAIANFKNVRMVYVLIGDNKQDIKYAQDPRLMSRIERNNANIWKRVWDDRKPPRYKMEVVSAFQAKRWGIDNLDWA
ncbi:hypothetical protein G7Y89_g861 [Cudoniella acicularis]|uniref:C3H1-type domain-containing protein n=1 Tax=Cudoniella acicularis TaxID=354080 RepID=A0A8H4RY11_9HELO|nr:hypothetical protein G7Y89_g861 [Cudoniella acicularis]